MERRKESRIKPHETLTVMVLSEGQPCMEGGVTDISERGLGLRLPAPVPVGSAIKIEASDELILGEVTHCEPDHGAYRTGVVVKHRLEGLAALHRMNRALHATQDKLDQPETVSLFPEK